MQKYFRSPLKWAGGKYRLLERILPALPAASGTCRRLVEPFVGSGAVFLNAVYPAALLCDSNADLISFFNTLLAQGPEFIQRARALFVPENNRAEAFYQLRDHFNSCPAGPERAALFLYLNRHAYNGLMRYNRRGGYNVPFGRYVAPRFPQAELAALLDKAARCRLEFARRDFRAVFAALEPGDLVYCDPPYVPLSASAAFTAYTAAGFGPEDQIALAACAEQAAGRGIPVVISNQDTEFTREIYKNARLSSFAVQRFISCAGGRRGKVPELLALYA